MGLMALTQRLDGEEVQLDEPRTGTGIDPVEVDAGLWLSDFHGATTAPQDALVISLCRTWGRLDHLDRRQIYLTDNADNLDVGAVIGDVLDTIEAAHGEHRPVLVHCCGGQSRTGLILTAYLRRKYGLGVREATECAGRLWPHLRLWEPSFDQALQRLAPWTPRIPAHAIPLVDGRPPLACQRRTGPV
jgi:ADP-ribosyl-[dinitrogen reductase] hydrolase